MDVAEPDFPRSDGDNPSIQTYSVSKQETTGITAGVLELAINEQTVSSPTEDASIAQTIPPSPARLPAEYSNVSSRDRGYPEDEAKLDRNALRKKRRLWVRNQVTGARTTEQVDYEAESRLPDKGPCWVCARRNLSQICPQLVSRQANPKIIIEDHLKAAVFAAEAANPSWNPNEQRVVFYTDMAAQNGAKHDVSVAGAGVTYRRIPEDDVSDWSDALYGILGTNRPDKAELYAIGMALQIALVELQTICEWLGNSEEQSEITAPTVIIITDSQASLYFIHDYVWQGTIPPMFSPEIFFRLMLPLARLQELKVPVYFHWVPSHTAIEGNCRADALAGRASKWTTESFPERMYQTSLNCEVIEIRGTTGQAYVPVYGKGLVKGASKRRKRSKRKVYSMLAKQIDGMQSKWVSDQFSQSYQPGST
ncbi:putative RNase H type-1 domain-containing protein [Seiridium cardinale]